MLVCCKTGTTLSFLLDAMLHCCEGMEECRISDVVRMAGLSRIAVVCVKLRSDHLHARQQAC